MSTLQSYLADHSIEVLSGKLYYVALPESFSPPTKGADNSYQCRFYNPEAHLAYEQFFADFGPVNLSKVVRFVREVHALLSQLRHSQRLYVLSTDHLHRRSNCAFLLGAYLVLCCNRTAPEACLPFSSLHPPLVPFRDAAFDICSYSLTILDCLASLERAVSMGHFSLNSFDVEAYDHFEKLENGDMNWIVPDKFLAFSGPLAKRREVSPGIFTLLAEDYANEFRRMGVTAVVRFNEKCYERRKFVDAGIHHYDLQYEDGANPPDEILKRFLELCEREKGAIAVHCKAGLGRTGTNIAAHLIKNYQYTAREAIAWCRICRPGCVVGPQQAYVMVLEPRLAWQRDRYSPMPRADSRSARRRRISSSTSSSSSSYVAGKNNAMTTSAKSGPWPNTSSSRSGDNGGPEPLNATSARRATGTRNTSTTDSPGSDVAKLRRSQAQPPMSTLAGVNPYCSRTPRSRGSLAVTGRQTSSGTVTAIDSGLVGASKAYGAESTADARRPTLYQSRKSLPYRRQRTIEERSSSPYADNYHQLSRSSSLNALQASTISRPRTSSGGSSGSSGNGSGVRGTRGRRPVTPNGPGTRGSLSVYARQMSGPRSESRW